MDNGLESGLGIGVGRNGIKRKARRGAVPPGNGAAGPRCGLLAGLLAASLAITGGGAWAIQPETDDESAALARELEQRERRVESLRGELGLYHPALGEAYGELGRFYLEQEEYGQSLASYNDALAITRVNDGLYSESQLPIIDAMIAGNEGLADWQEVDDLHYFRYHVAGRLWELSDSRHLAALSTWGDWKMRAIRENLLGDGVWGARWAIDETDSVYRRAIATLEQAPQARPLELASLVRGKAELDIHMLRLAANTPYRNFPSSVPRYINQLRCRMVPGPNGQPLRRCVNVQVQNPRYENSQLNSKRTAIMRYSGAVNAGIERLVEIRDGGYGLSSDELARLEADIAMLEAENRRSNRRGRLF